MTPSSDQDKQNKFKFQVPSYIYLEARACNSRRRWTGNLLIPRLYYFRRKIAWKTPGSRNQIVCLQHTTITLKILSMLMEFQMCFFNNNNSHSQVSSLRIQSWKFIPEIKAFSLGQEALKTFLNQKLNETLFFWQHCNSVIRAKILGKGYKKHAFFVIFLIFNSLSLQSKL